MAFAAGAAAHFTFVEKALARGSSASSAKAAH